MPHLDLGSISAVVHFMEDQLELLRDADQKKYRETVARAKSAERISRTELVGMAKTLAETVWPLRRGGDVEAARRELADMKKRFDMMREQAARMTNVVQQDLLLAKLAAFEDRVYFGGESIPLEILDAELAYDIADREVPPSEEPMM